MSKKRHTPAPTQETTAKVTMADIDRLEQLIIAKAKEKKYSSSQRAALAKLLNKDVKKAAAEREAFSRQVGYDTLEIAHEVGPDRTVKVLKPKYNPVKMMEIAEESGALSACIDAYIRNIAGYGFKIVPRQDAEGVDETVNEAERTKLQNLFDTPNGIESWTSLRKKLRRDYEHCGNYYMEVVRDRTEARQPTLFMWCDARITRLCPVEPTPLTYQVTVMRDGKEVPFTIRRQFRKYVTISISSDGQQRALRFFKEFGDPRPMNALTGRYYDKAPQDENDLRTARETKFEAATELLHYKYGNDAYGVPRWVGQILTAMGISRADYVNFDLFDNQGIPPMIITVAGGQLTDDSFKDLMSTLKAAKGVGNFNKILLIEVESLSDHIDQTGREPIPKVEAKSMTDYRKEDAMFTNYIDKGNDNVRELGFRLPSLFIGDNGSFNYATAMVAREATEEQVFAPERADEDDFINNTIVKSLGVKTVLFKSGVPVYTNTENLVNVLADVAENGALTIDELIGVVNRFFGTNIQPYNKPWSKIPITFVKNPQNDPTGVMPAPRVPGNDANVNGGGGTNSHDIARTNTTDEDSDDGSPDDNSSADNSQTRQ